MKRNQPSVESVQNRALQAFLPKLESSVSPSSLPFSHPSLIHPSRPSAGRDRGALTSCLQPTHGISIVENRRHALSLSHENTARLQAWTGGGVNTTPPVRCQSCLITGIGNQSFGLSSFPWRNDLYRWHVDNEGTCIIISPTGPQPLYFAPLSVSLPPLTSLLLFPLTPHPRPSLFDVVVVRLRGFTRLHRIRGRLHGHCERSGAGWNPEEGWDTRVEMFQPESASN